MVSPGRGAELGIFIKGHQALEAAKAIDTVVLDKTGTTTTGRMAVVDVALRPGTELDTVLHHAGAVEDASEHAVAAAISALARPGRYGPRPSATAAVAELHQRGLRTVLLTGDNTATALAVAAQVGIDEVIAEVLPPDKAVVIEQLQAQGRSVAMVGGGVNDAPALAIADLGLAVVAPTSRSAPRI